MFKLMLLLTTFFGQYHSNDHYQIIVEEVRSENNTNLIYKQGEYLIYEHQNKYIFSYLNKKIYESDKFINYKFILKENHLLLFYYNNGYLYLIEIDPTGKEIFKGKIIENKIDFTYDIILKDCIYIIGTVSEYDDLLFISGRGSKKEKDAFIIRLNNDYSIKKLKIYGGILNESFIKVTYSDSFLYIVGKKDPLSGGDFGNGGKQNNSVFITKIDFNLDLIDYVILQTHAKISFFSYTKDYLYLGLADNLYKVDDDLNILFKKAITNNISISITSMNNIVVLSEGKGYLYDIYDFSLQYQFLISVVSKESKVFISDCIIIKNSNKRFYFDVADFRDFIVFDTFYRGIHTSKKVVTLFGEAEMIDEISNPIFNPLIFGSYFKSYIFKNVNGIIFYYEKIIEVPIQINVIEGLIYPTGYKLSFTGMAFLNGDSIVNNHSLDHEGEYLLELYGVNNDKYQVSFKVASDQIKFTSSDNSIRNLDIRKRETFYLNFEFNNNIEIESFLINGKIYNDFIIDKVNNSVNLKMLSEDSLGLHYYFIEKVYYYQYLLGNSDIRGIDINQMYVVNVLKDEPKLSLIRNFDFLLFANLDDKEATARHFEVKAISDQEEIIEIYSLANNRIILNNLKSKDYQITISLCYDLGNADILKLEIIQINIKDCEEIDIGSFEITQKTLTLESFKLVINEHEAIKSISLNNQLLYTNTPKNNGIYIIGVLVMISSLFLSNELKRILKKKRTNNYRN